ncbi:translation initiation factor IF-2 N-terminal domain-containing protein [Corynebacterium anserum]|uniref:translation initiation factor IF-2 N-terminal domain-containing protein n=1 Tax=Corynebacterium anserum TaxID=2684406 RepID=UPI0028BDA17E|nr:translation initiation factor IF-2 N-terminal domain-containing protein [Corynebacterium anserum]
MAISSQELSAQAAQIDRDQLGEKTRVHALAKMLGVSSAEMLTILAEYSIEGKRPASTVTKQQVGAVLDALASTQTIVNKSGKKTAKNTTKKTAKKTAKKAVAKKTAKKTSTQTAEPTAPVTEESSAQQADNVTVEGKPARQHANKTVKRTTRKKASGNTVEAVQSPEASAEPDSPADKNAAENTPADKNDKEAVENTPADKNYKDAVEKTSADKSYKDAVEQASEDKDSDQKAVAVKSQTDDAEQRHPDVQEEPKEKTTRRRVRRVVRRYGASEQLAQENSEEHAKEAAPGHIDSLSDQDATSQREDTPQSDTESDKEESRSNSARRSRRRRRSRGRRGTRTTGKQEQIEAPLAGEQDNEEDKKTYSDEEERKTHAEEIKPEKLHPAERDEADIVDEPVRVKGSTRLESRRKWRQENRREPRHIVSRSEFLARRESVERKMVVRDSERTDKAGLTTQVGVVEDGMLVEHFVASETQSSIVGNIYLGTVQNVLGSMEAAFIDIGTGRNAVLYAGEMNWHSPHLHTKTRRIDQALKAGDQIMVQVIKDPLGHKGARLTGRISFAGRYLVYFPGGTTAGISRKLPEGERKRLKEILTRVVPGEGGAIIRTAAENVEEERIREDVERLHRIWESVAKEETHARSRKGAKPIALYEEPNMLVKVVRDIFNEDFTELIVEGEQSWSTVRDYVGRMAPDLKDRVVKWHPQRNGGQDVFAAMNLDEQLAKALSRKVWLPSGGHLVFDHTEAMTVIDVNTGSFIGSGGNLEETVTQNNLEAAEEIVRQMRLRDLGGMIVVDFIDMVLEENQDLVLRRLTEFLGRDRTRHKVSEVTSLGLVQMTRKRLGTGLLETFSTVCEHCGGRGVIIHADPVEDHGSDKDFERRDHGNRKVRQQLRREQRLREEAQARRASAEAVQTVHAASTPEDVPEEEAHAKPSETPQNVTQDERAVAHPRRRVRRVVRRHNVPTIETSSGSRGTRSKKSSTSADRAAARRVESRRESDQQQVRHDDRDHGRTDGMKQGRRRMRRVVRSARRVVDQPSMTRPDENEVNGSAQDHVSVLTHENTRSFDEAQREFDSSPRRKRNTRGNSRSDIPPRPEDFATGVAAEDSDGKKSSRRPMRTARRRSVRRSSGERTASTERKTQVQAQGGKRRVRRVVRRVNEN